MAAAEFVRGFSFGQLEEVGVHGRVGAEFLEVPVDDRLDFVVLRGEPFGQGVDQLLEVFVGGRDVRQVFGDGNSTCSGDGTETR